jgi:iron complex outermembrane recepter protein
MKRNFYFLALSLTVLLCSAWQVKAQTSISGKITEAGTGLPLAGVNILVKGRVVGTISDANGNFSLRSTDNPPITLVFSFIGFASQEIQITSANTTNLNVQLEEQTLLGSEVVISASRIEESIMESPVSIEKMDILAVQNTPADNYYKGIAYLKGVDVTTSSINFQIINTRGFGSTGNTRFMQLTDGMDTQAPALNFPIGNLNGPSELDVESVELIPGAASALYGPNAFNGVLLVNSKSPFDYQGVSAFTKMGVNHIGPNADQDAALMSEFSVRYAKAFNNKFAFKVNFSRMQADDWHGTDDTDREIGRTPTGFNFNPGADRLHFMGDEASIPLAIFRLSANTPAGPGWQAIASSGIGLFEPGVTAWEYAQNGWLPAHVVSAPSYRESDLVDYNAQNTKANVGLYYRLNDKVELSYLYNGGWGTSIYTGAQRYSLANFNIQQHRLQLRGDNFYLRGYTTIENSGDSYIAEFLAKRINDIRSGGNVSSYLGNYGIFYLRHLYNEGFTDPTQTPNVPLDVQQAAHVFARQQTDNRFPMTPGTQAFEDAKRQALEGVVPFGPKFADATRLYHVEGQYDFKNEIDFMELQVGGSYRLFDLRSNGTIFDDGDEPITIAEYGAYAQAGKWLGDRKLKLSGSVRYDKNENFKGQVNPRISALFKAAENHNIRASLQTGFRNPTTQGQHIDLNIISARLLGGLPRYAEKYDIVRTLPSGQPGSYEGFSVERYRNAVFAQGGSPAAIFNPANTALLVPYTSFEPVKPERVQSLEVGYKGLINNKLMLDISYYYNVYNDFISQVRIVTASPFTAANAPVPALIGTANYATILNSSAGVVNSDGSIAGNTYQIYTNIDDKINTQGVAAGFTYSLSRGYTIMGNYSWNVINDVPDGFLAEFNTPEHKVNIGFGNRKVTDRFGFNVNLRWQDEFEWQSSFTIPANGMVPAYSTLDAQVSYKVPSMKSVFKLGGSNLMNQMYIQSLGGPNIGAIYYLSVTFDELMR